MCLNMLGKTRSSHKHTGHHRDIVDLVPDHGNKANTAAKRVTHVLRFPSACESYVYALLESIKCAVAL